MSSVFSYKQDAHPISVVSIILSYFTFMSGGTCTEFETFQATCASADHSPCIEAATIRLIDAHILLYTKPVARSSLHTLSFLQALKARCLASHHLPSSLSSLPKKEWQPSVNRRRIIDNACANHIIKELRWAQLNELPLHSFHLHQAEPI